MKILSVAEAQKQLNSVCEEAAAGEVVRLQLTNGTLVQLSPVSVISAADLAASYDDPEWAQFENHCGKSSD